MTVQPTLGDAPDPSLAPDERIVDEEQYVPLEDINADEAEVDQPTDSDANDEASAEPPLEGDA